MTIKSADKKISMVSIAIISQSYCIQLIIATETMFIFLAALFIVKFAKNAIFSVSQYVNTFMFFDFVIKQSNPTQCSRTLVVYISILATLC